MSININKMEKQMNHQIVISGLGGQGVLFVTRVLAQACMDDDKRVLTSETHGMAQRGGTVISHLKVGTFNSPLIRPGNADLLLTLKQENYLQHRGFLKLDGKALVNSEELVLKGLDSTPMGMVEGLTLMDGNKMAKADDNARSFNLYMLGGALGLMPVCSLERVKARIEKIFSAKGETIIAKALLAVETGYNYTQKYRKEG